MKVNTKQIILDAEFISEKTRTGKVQIQIFTEHYCEDEDYKATIEETIIQLKNLL